MLLNRQYWLRVNTVTAEGITASGFESDRWSEILASLKINPMCFGRGWPKTEATIKAGAEVPLIFVTKTEGLEICQLELVKLVGGPPIVISLDYESIYGDAKHLTANSKIYSHSIDELYKLVAPK